WAVEDRPSQAKWASDKDVPTFPMDSPAGKKTASGLAFLQDRNVWIFLTLNLSFACGAYGMLIWLPTAIKGLGARNNLVVGILTAMPYLFAGFGAVFNSRLSDRAHERRWH